MPRSWRRLGRSRKMHGGRGGVGDGTGLRIGRRGGPPVTRLLSLRKVGFGMCCRRHAVTSSTTATSTSVGLIGTCVEVAFPGLIGHAVHYGLGRTLDLERCRLSGEPRAPDRRSLSPSRGLGGDWGCSSALAFPRTRLQNEAANNVAQALVAVGTYLNAQRSLCATPPRMAERAGRTAFVRSAAEARRPPVRGRPAAPDSRCEVRDGLRSARTGTYRRHRKPGRLARGPTGR